MRADARTTLSGARSVQHVHTRVRGRAMGSHAQRERAWRDRVTQVGGDRNSLAFRHQRGFAHDAQHG
jgi:hypothetical protein